MTHGPLRLPLSDILDRLSIELRKQYYGHGNDPLIEDLRQEVYGRIAAIQDPQIYFRVLMGATLLGIRNADIANLEWQMRAGQDLSLEEHGRRALAIRKINDGRNEAKRMISEALGENVETKHYGYGDFDGSKITFGVQESAPVKVGHAGIAAGTFPELEASPWIKKPSA